MFQTIHRRDSKLALGVAQGNVVAVLLYFCWIASPGLASQVPFVPKGHQDTALVMGLLWAVAQTAFSLTNLVLTQRLVKKADVGVVSRAGRIHGLYGAALVGCVTNLAISIMRIVLAAKAGP